MPLSFQTLTNQPRVASLLKEALAKNRLAHALLFQGPVGAGQRSAAMELAKALFCLNRRSDDACGVCTSCLQAAKQTHPDFFILEPQEDSAGGIKIEQVRQLTARAGLKPLLADYKVFIIDPADAMNESAQNALLKTLEEPEGKTVFVLLTSHPEVLLPTVRSRCQVFSFLPVGDQTEDDAELAGLKRETLQFLFHSLSDASQAPDLSSLEREELTQVLDYLIDVFRDLLIFKSGAEEIIPPSVDFSEKSERARHYGVEELGEKIEYLSEFKEKILQNMNKKLTLAALWEKLKK